MAGLRISGWSSGGSRRSGRRCRLEMDAHYPWAEQGVWAADDGSAYMLPPDEPYTPTAYFFIRGEWRAFAVVCGPSYSLWFEDPETGERAFESDFDLDETTVTLRRVKRSDYSYIRPKKTYLRPHQSGGL